MTKPKIKVLILSNVNPLATQLSGLAVFKNVSVETKDYHKNINLGDYKLVISMAYLNMDHVVSMNALRFFYETCKAPQISSKPRFIFFSWFHPLGNVNQYTNFFSAEKGEFEIMNTKNCHIIQLPFSETVFENSVKNLLNSLNSD